MVVWYLLYPNRNHIFYDVVVVELLLYSREEDAKPNKSEQIPSFLLIMLHLLRLLHFVFFIFKFRLPSYIIF